MKEKAEIRVAEETDKKGVLRLLNKVFSKHQKMNIQRGDAFWQWKFEDNIFGDSILTVADYEGEIVGVDHLWPWQFQCRGVIINACQPCDSVVKPDYRGNGYFKQMRTKGIKIAKNRGYKLLFNFPNENSLTANLQLGGCYLGKINWWVKVLKPLDLAKNLFRSDPSLPISIDDKYKLDIDILDKLAAKNVTFDHYFAINRKSGFHKWRYLDKPTRQYGMISLEQSNKKIAGIFTLNQNGICREMVLVDIVGDPKLSESLILEIVKVARSLNATFLALMNNYKFNTNQLWKSGFFKKRLKNMVVLPIDLAIESKVSNFKNWALIAGMHDSI